MQKSFTAPALPAPRRSGSWRLAPRNIRGILVLLLLVVWLPIMLLEVGLHYMRFADRRALELQANLEVARAIAISLDNFLEDLQGQERAIGLAIASADHFEEIQLLLDTEAAEHAANNYYFWTDPQGVVVAASLRDLVGSSIARQSYFLSLLNGGEWAVSDVDVDDLRRAPTFVVTRAIRAPDDQMLGVLGVVLQPDQLSTMLRVEREGRGEIALYNELGRLIYSYPLPLDRTVWKAGATDYLAASLEGKEVTGTFVAQSDGRERLGAFVPSPLARWVVVASRPVDEALEAEVQDIVNEGLLYLVVGLISILVAIRICSVLTMPLSRLRDHALAIGGGDFGRTITIEHPDELAELGRAFDRMGKEIALREGELQDHVAELQRTEQELLVARDELEARVQERTAQLAGSEERWRSVVQTAENAIILVDARGRIAFWNRAAQRIFGYSPDQIVGSDLATIIPARVWLEHLEGFQQAAAGSHASREERTFESIALLQDGHEFPCELSLGRFTSHGETVFTGIVRDITSRKQGEASLNQSIERLRSTLEHTVQAMAALVERRDPYTAGHQRRVAHLAHAIARAMGLSEELAAAIRLASSVHDIGKIAVPSEILVKPGRISEWELDLIKTHPQTGFEILKTIDFPWPIAEIVRQHHERLDGSGYPNALAGDAILLEARIIAVADLVEAMASFRPYRPAIGIDEAIAELERDSPRLYDSSVVAACLAVLRGGFEWE